jgi:hypothetical protein
MLYFSSCDALQPHRLQVLFHSLSQPSWLGNRQFNLLPAMFSDVWILFLCFWTAAVAAHGYLGGVVVDGK